MGQHMVASMFLLGETGKKIYQSFTQITRLSNRFSALARKTETILRRIELSDQEKLRYGSQIQSFSSGKNRKKDITVKWNQTTSSVKV